MKPTFGNTEPAYDWRHILETHEVMYLVKRPSYEFCLAIPREQGTHLSQGGPLLKLQFREQCHTANLVLDSKEIEDLFNGLSRLIEYVRAEKTMRREEP